MKRVIGYALLNTFDWGYKLLTGANHQVWGDFVYPGVWFCHLHSFYEAFLFRWTGSDFVFSLLSASSLSLSRSLCVLPMIFSKHQEIGTQQRRSLVLATLLKGMEVSWESSSQVGIKGENMWRVFETHHVPSIKALNWRSAVFPVTAYHRTKNRYGMVR